MSKDDTNRAKLARLADALVEDIMAMSDADILAETDPAAIARARAILSNAQGVLARAQLAKAKAEQEAWRAAHGQRRRTFDRAEAHDRFEKFRRTDPAFNQRMTLAARNGKEPTDKDKEGLIEDWADLQKLDEQDTSK